MSISGLATLPTGLRACLTGKIGPLVRPGNGLSRSGVLRQPRTPKIFYQVVDFGIAQHSLF